VKISPGEKHFLVMAKLKGPFIPSLLKLT